MSKTVYNVIWADDEVNFYMREEPKKRFLEKNNIEVIATATTGDEFRLKFEKFKHKIDAVITDANFNRKDSLPIDDRDMSGFTVVREMRHAMSHNDKEIPFFLYTGRGAFIKEKYTDGELDYFIESKRIFTKDEFKQLCERIPIDVEEVESPSYRIRKKYKISLDKALLLPENEETLFRLLLAHESGYNQELHKPQDDFNALRKIIESILEDGKKRGLFPEQLESINSLKRYLRNDEASVEWSGFYCPPTLAYGVGFLIDVSQDGSHKYEKLKLKADEYVTSTCNDNIIMCLTYIAMDLCVWYAEAIDTVGEDPLWKIRETTSGTVSLIRGKFYCGSSEVQSLRNGDEIEITKMRPHISPYQIYDDKLKSSIQIDSYIPLGDYRIIQKKREKSSTSTK
ncbi:MAG: hypothetical protein K2O88_04660 [Paramuribaculum sp.]|nr:hypothetical protein [Paramuribaculum sp.]